MKLIVGLGNPGDKYKGNRHNVGQMVLEGIQRSGISAIGGSAYGRSGQGSEIRLVRPEIFMNESGVAVRKAMNFYKLGVEDLIVIHDDLDIRLGEYKIDMARGPKQHNGVTSVEEELRTKDFLRVRVGVDNRDQSSGIRVQGDKYVLEDFTDEERTIIDGVIEKIVDELKMKYAIK